jgi:cytoskeleton protein RodZ
MVGEARNDRGSGLGSTLREHRLKQGTGLREIALSLRIRESFLRAIEDGRFDRLPGPAYAAGFIRSYAELLGFDGDEAVRQFRTEAAGMNETAALQFPTPMSENSVPRGGVILVGLLVAGVAYGGWYISTIRDRTLVELVAPLPERLASVFTGRDNPERAMPQPRAESRAGGGGETGIAVGEAIGRQAAAGRMGGEPAAAIVGGASDASSPLRASPGESANVATAATEASADRFGTEIGGATAAGGSAAATRGAANALAAEPSVDDEGGESGAVHAALAGNAAAIEANGSATGSPSGRIVLKANALTWVQVREQDGGRVLMSGLLKQGETYGVPDQRGLRLTVGNAGGLDILVDGRPTQTIGKAGEVRRGLVLDPDALGNSRFVFD